MKRYSVFGCVMVAVLMCAFHAADAWEIETVAGCGSGGTDGFSSIAYDSEGYPHILYYNNGALEYARWTGAGWDRERVYELEGGTVGRNCSMALDGEDNPHISFTYFLENVGAGASYGYKDSSGWHFENVAQSRTTSTSIALGRDSGLNAVVPHIAYTVSDELWHAWLDPQTSMWQKEIVDGTGSNSFASIAVDDGQEVYISYYDSTGKDLKFAHNDGTQWSTVVIDSEGDVGSHTSLVVDSLGVVHITYYDATNRWLKHVSLTQQ